MEILFWVILGVIFYTYAGYAIVLRIMVLVKELFVPRRAPMLPDELPTVTLFITAWNEEKVVEQKMCNSLALHYPKSLLTIMWVTDGSTDGTNDAILHYPDARILFTKERKGKCAAMNRGMQYVESEITIFTDANTLLNAEAVNEIVRQFSRWRVGCVAGEKRIDTQSKQVGAAASGEGAYWRYESKVKDWESRLYSTVGAAGELFAIRTPLFRPLRLDTLLDDFTIAVKLAVDGHMTAYTSGAYAIETASESIAEERKRKVRIAAGGLQAIVRLKKAINPLNNPLFTFEYVSHRVLRWTISPVLLLMLLPLNIIAVVVAPSLLLWVVLVMQIMFDLMAYVGYLLDRGGIRQTLFYIPFYFWFMNINVLHGYTYLRRKRGSGAWERARRA